MLVASPCHRLLLLCLERRRSVVDFLIRQTTVSSIVAANSTCFGVTQQRQQETMIPSLASKLIFHLYVLFATPKDSYRGNENSRITFVLNVKNGNDLPSIGQRNRSSRKKSTPSHHDSIHKNSNQNGQSPKKSKGRQRYNRSGTKQTDHSARYKFSNHEKDKEITHNKHLQEHAPMPSVTDPKMGPCPTYYTCRHTYEQTLIEELQRLSSNKGTVSSPYPGVVMVENNEIPCTTLIASHDDTGRTNTIGSKRQLFWDPIYALQVLPQCHIVQCSNSIKGLARSIATLEQFQNLLSSCGQQSQSGGQLAVHAVVPGMCKGQKDPILQRRSILVAETVVEMWKKQYPVARRRRRHNVNSNVDNDDSIHDQQGGSTSRRLAADVIEDNKEEDINDALLLQILLLSPDVAAVSLTLCEPTVQQSMMLSSSSSSTINLPINTHWLWPSPVYPVGMAKVDIDTHEMPSSAYRKLLEAFAYCGMQPSGNDSVVDLGASPGT